MSITRQASTSAIIRAIWSGGRATSDFEEPLTELVAYATAPEFLSTSFGVPTRDAHDAVAFVREARLGDPATSAPYRTAVIGMEHVLQRVAQEPAQVEALARHLADACPRPGASTT